MLCLGGAKIGLPVGEAVVFFNRDLATDFAYRCKQAGQLASKMRFLTAPWLGMLRDSAWLRRAEHANRMAAKLSRNLAEVAGVELLYPTEANAVFAYLAANGPRATRPARLAVLHLHRPRRRPVHVFLGDHRRRGRRPADRRSRGQRRNSSHVA